MGIGYKMLKLALKKIFKTRLYAVVKKNNEVSIKIFKIRFYLPKKSSKKKFYLLFEK